VYAARQRRSTGAWTRVRWDRVGRTGLLIVLVVVAGLYLKDAINFIGARSQAEYQHANVRRLARENAALRKQQAALNNPVSIKRDARALGMVQAGERPYVVIGLPKH
jgi:cell division protein FtsB